MLNLHTPRKPAPMLARGALWLGRRGGPDAFGNAIGSSVADSMSRGVDWSQAPDQSDAETARLTRQNSELRDAEYLQQSDAILNRKAADAWTATREQQWIDQDDAILRRKAFDRLEGINGMDAQSDAWVAANGTGKVGRRVFGVPQPKAVDAWMRPDGGLDARDMRNTFTYKGRLKLELNKAESMLAYRQSSGGSPGAELRPSTGPLSEGSAMAYLRSQGALGPRAGSFEMQVGRQLPEAFLTVGAPELIPARVTALLGKGAQATQGLLFGERSVLMSQLNADMRIGLEASLPLSAGAVDVVSNRALTIPKGLTQAQFDSVSHLVHTRAETLGLGDDIFVQGSRAGGTAHPGSDLDIAIRVSPERFEEFLNTQSTLRNVNPGSSAEKTRQYSIENGIIQRGEARLSPLGRLLERQLGMDVDISVIRAGGKFDTAPAVFLPKPGKGG